MIFSKVRNNTYQILYPFKRTCTYDTNVIQFRTGREQRSKRRDCLMEFDMTYSRLVYSDSVVIRTIGSNMNGMFLATNSLTADGITYDNLGLDQDYIEFTENAGLRYDTTLKVVQVAPSTVPVVEATVTGTPTYPFIIGSIITQLPFVSCDQYSTISDRLSSGGRQSFAFYGGGLTNFPTRPLKYWTLSHPMLTLSQATKIEQFYHWAWGRYKHFTFTDPDSGVAYSNVRFDTDRLEIFHRDFNKIDVTVKLREFFV